MWSIENLQSARFKVKLISVSDIFRSCIHPQIEISIILQMSDWLHPSKIYTQPENRVGAWYEIKFLLNFNYTQPWHRNGKKRHKNPSHKRWSILNYYRWIQNMLCTCVNQLYALLIARCTKLTPQRTYICTSLICNQKLMKITLQPHFLLLQNVSFLRDNFDGSTSVSSTFVP